MNILRIITSSVIIAILLTGCDSKSAVTPKTDVAKTQPTHNVSMLTPNLQTGDTKEYWIQSYSSLSDGKTTPSNKTKQVGIKALISYQVEKANNKQIDVKATANHIELFITDTAGYIDTLLQNALTQGIHYQLNLNSKTPLIIRHHDKKIEEQIANSIYLLTEDKYLRSILTPPILPTALPLAEGQQINLPHYMQLDNLTIKIDKITHNNIDITLKAQNGQDHLYGKAILQKSTGWIEKLALVKEVPLEGRTDYKMRTTLLVGPSDWSSSNVRQLQQEMQIETMPPYQAPFSVFDFNVAQWQTLQKEELNNPTNQGKLYTLTNPDGTNQIMLVTSNNQEAIPQLLGHYQITHLALFTSDNKPITPNTLLPTTNSVYKIKTNANTETNLASYKLKINSTTANTTLKDINKITANINFTPYEIEKITIPLTNENQASTQDHHFNVNINPTNQAKTYILQWHAKDNIIFNPQLMKGADNALIQYIQPDTEDWLTPAETRIVNSLSYGFQNTVKITFTNAPPKQLELYVIKKDNNAKTSAYTINFNRNN